MPVPLKYAVRCLMIAVVVAVAVCALAPSTSSSNPYISSLAQITVGTDLAAAGCSNSVCALHKNRCNPVDPSRFQNCSKAGGTCMTSSC